MAESPDRSLTPPPSGGSAITQESRVLACLSYASVLFGLPLFIIPLAQKNDAFAMFHARQAAVAWIGLLVCFFAYFFISFITCGFGALLFPILMLPYIPAIHGVIIALGDETREPIGVFGLGERLLGNLRPQ